jgi:TrpR-related protein YerC/YecD
MQISKQEIKKNTEKEITTLLYQLIADLHNPLEAQKLIQGIFTDAEIITLAKRIAVAKLLVQKQSYEYIKNELKVSSATIAAIQSKLHQQNGYSLAIKKINTDQWATKWAKRISAFLENK